MSWVLVALSSGSAGAALWWALKMRGRLNQIQQKYAPALQIDRYIQEEESKFAEAKIKAKQELEDIHNKGRTSRLQLEKDLASLKVEYEGIQHELAETEKQLSLSREETVYQSYGYYEPNYGFESPGEWEHHLKLLNTEIKNMLGHVQNAEKATAKKLAAGYIQEVVSFNNSTAKGIKMQKASIQLLLRAFNGECDSFIVKVAYKSVTLMQRRIQSSYEAICKVGERKPCINQQ